MGLPDAFKGCVPNVVSAVMKFREVPKWARRTFTEQRKETMVVFGLILLIIGFVLAFKILWTIGMIFLIVGLVLWAMGALGHAIGGHKHYY
jgi:uncharacterized membrane protein